MALIPSTVQRGDLITAEFVNNLVAQINALDGRLLKIEGAVQDSTPASGSIRLSSIRAEAKTLGVDDHDTPHRFFFELVNSTNKALDFLLIPTVQNLSGSWKPVVETTLGQDQNSIRVPSLRTADLAVTLKVPSDAKQGEKGTLILTTKVGAPHFRTAEDRFDNITIGATTGAGQNKILSVARTDSSSLEFAANSTDVKRLEFKASLKAPTAGETRTFQFLAKLTAQGTSTALAAEWEDLITVTGLPAGTVGGKLTLNSNDPTDRGFALLVQFKANTGASLKIEISATDMGGDTSLDTTLAPLSFQVGA